MMELDRLRLLIGKENLEALKEKTVLVLGLGGVGGYAVEALSRSGIGHLVIVDSDIIDTTNINRQIIALHSTLGKKKTEVWKDRILDIRPDCKITIIQQFIDEENIEMIFRSNIDFAIDACDTTKTKIAFLKYCLKNEISFITCLGTGNRLDSSKVYITDLMKTQYDPLAKKIRKLVREQNIKGKIPVVFSSEIPQKNAQIQIASSIFVPSIAGIMAANYAMMQLLEVKK